MILGHFRRGNLYKHIHFLRTRSPSTKRTHYAVGMDEMVHAAFQITHHRYQIFLLMFHKPATSHLWGAMQAGEK